MKRFGLALLACILVACPSASSQGEPATSEPPPVPTRAEPSPSSTPSAGLELSYDSGAVKIQLPWRGAEVWRGYLPLASSSEGEPVVYRKLKSDLWVDPVPHGMTLFYMARSPAGEVLEGYIESEPRTLATLMAPRLHIDKENYTLTIYEGERQYKRYPIALGRNPVNRKFCQDNASTPEGIYRIYNLQPEATFYRAFDIDYPNGIDRLRHQAAIARREIEEHRSIGGEIQIHGMGIGSNWTHGCIALRNEDMDELFAHPEIGVNTEVFISGSQIERGDRRWLLAPDAVAVKKVQARLKAEKFYQGEVDGDLGEGTAHALGLFQQAHGLQVSCQLDGRTRRFLKLP